MKMKILPDGTIRCLYTEELDLAGLGTVTITRASNVEPDKDGRWVADMAPSGVDIKLGGFAKRSEALAAEVAFVEENIL